MIDDSQDIIGGYHPDPAIGTWPSGSCFEVEGKYLYRTVREMKPGVIVEVGRWAGCYAVYDFDRRREATGT